MFTASLGRLIPYEDHICSLMLFDVINSVQVLKEHIFALVCPY